MYQDASYAALTTTAAEFAGSGASAPGRRPGGLTWRHAATGLLLLLAVPVFAVAAVACLPVLLVVAGGQSLLRIWALARNTHPPHGAGPTLSH